MPEKVLVAYGSTNGSTARIAETVAAVLRERGVAAEALPARSMTDVKAYDAVVVGGGLYAGHWHRDARRFVRRFRGELRLRPVALFSSGPLDGSAQERDIPPAPGVERVMRRLDVTEHVTFGGCLREGARGWVGGMILRSGKGGDFRDFATIECWAGGLVEKLATGRTARR
ncbi:flavodoxin domain-containing protein [Streptomyces sp. NPDC047853]|uniref:flavodoxin domain-containing protein n=1 Tax=unclassified Streptomyces TaxID=2593676 RepID=UPI003456A427